MAERRARPNVPKANGKRLTDLPEADITLPQLARAFGVNRKTVLKWIEARLIPALRLPDGDYRFERAEVLAFRDRQRLAASASSPL